MLRTEVLKETKISDTMVLLRLFDYQGALTVRYHRQRSFYRRRLFAAYETIAVILGHSDTKTTRKSYARPSIGMLRKEMAKGNPPESQNNGKEEMPLWTNDEELARLCGIR